MPGKNKDRKQRKHNILMRKVAEKAKERLALLQECVDKAKTTAYVIKRIVGTPNISRLKSFLDETIFDQEWFLNRNCSKGLRKLVKDTKLAKYAERMGANLPEKVDSRYK